jgi:hypothetical protein
MRILADKPDSEVVIALIVFLLYMMAMGLIFFF